MHQQASIHPLEEVLRLIDREAPEPWYPRQFLRQSGADPDNVSALLEHLALEGLIQKVPGRNLDSGSGVKLTPLGQEVVRDTNLLDRLINGEAIRPDDTGAIIRNDLRKTIPPYATYTLIAVNVLIFAAGQMDARTGNWMFVEGAAAAGNIYKGGEWWRLLTSTFLHAGIAHVFCNMFSLYSVGSFVEQAWGRWRYLVIYFIAGWGGSCLAMAYQPANPAVGASGAVCGVLGAIGVWFLLYGRHLRAGAARSGLWQVGISVALIAGIGFVVPNVSNWGHLGGGIAGALAALVLHVQRFGLPALKVKAPVQLAAVLVLLFLPVASYLQMRNALATPGRRLAEIRKIEKKGNDKGDDRGEEKQPKKDGENKGGDRGEAGPFLRHHGKPLRKAANALYETCGEMPIAVADIMAKPKMVAQAREQIEQQGQVFKEQLGALTDARFKDKELETLREEGLALTNRALALCAVALDHLKLPTDAGRKKLQDRYTAFESIASEYVKKIKALDKR